ncbi:MAG: hypothetical protein B2I17_06910 [Thermoplasmatales archaeon B_DKE]|nr:MAG: hypothetical protein B2I17_06910 [Thermoplasmatales archaeon B_DKE]
MDIEFGTYHHSTREASDALRKNAEKIFTSLMYHVYASDSRLEILDAGCGLGFLTSVASRCFPSSILTAIDIFEHNSLSEATYEKALENMKALGIESRVTLLRHDLTESLNLDSRFDLAISNLVFHNLGKKRFLGYESVFKSLKPGGILILGDLFPQIEKDTEFFNRFGTIQQKEGDPDAGKWSYRVIMVKKR